MLVLQGRLVTTSMKTLTVLGLLAQLLCSSHAQVRSFPEPRNCSQQCLIFPSQTPIPFAPLDSSMRSLTMLARDFPSIDAVPDAATFGEFQEVRLQKPKARQRGRQSSAPANTFPLDKPFVSFPTTPAPDPPRAPPQRNFPPPRGQPSRDFPSRQQPSRNFPQPPRQSARNFPPTPRPPPVTAQPSRNGRPRVVTPVPSISVTPGSSLDIILTSAERRDILDKLLGRDISTIVLTPLQRLAILQENELRQAEARGQQPQPPPQRPTKAQRLPPPKPNTTPRPRQPPAQTNFQSTFRPQSNFQTSFAPDFGRQENTFVSTTAVPSRQPTTQRPRQPEIPRNFVGGQQISDNSIDVNYDYNDYDNPNPVSSKTMIEQTFSLFENFANRKNGGKGGGVSAPVSPFKRPSLRFLPEEQSPRPSLPLQTPRPPAPRAPPPPPPTTRAPPPATTRRPRPRPAPTAQRQRVSRVRIKVPQRPREETPRSFGREETPRSFGRNSVQTSSTRDRFPIGRLNMDNFLPTTTIAPRTTASPQPPQQQIVRTTTQQPSFPAVSPGQFRPPVREQVSCVNAEITIIESVLNIFSLL